MNKHVKTFVAGLLFLPIVGGLEIKKPIIDIATATPTPTPTINTFQIKPNLIKNIEAVQYEFKNKRGDMRNVEITAKDATSITVDNDGTSVKVTLEANTHFRRKFWGKSTLSETSVGDKLDVIGRWTNEERTEMKAVLIRNLSIQKRYGVFFGTVKSMTDTGFVMTTIHRGEEKVTIGTETKIINREENAITLDDIAVDARVRVRGLWDSEAFTIAEVTEVKDFSLPVVTE